MKARIKDTSLHTTSAAATVAARASARVECIFLHSWDADCRFEVHVYRTTTTMKVQHWAVVAVHWCMRSLSNTKQYSGVFSCWMGKMRVVRRSPSHLPHSLPLLLQTWVCVSVLHWAGCSDKDCQQLASSTLTTSLLQWSPLHNLLL